MAATMQATAEAIENQMNNGNNGNNGDEGPMTLSSFLKVHPPTFRGTSNPTDADNWIQTITRALQAQQFPEEQWIEFGTYQLQEFYKKYFSNSIRNAKELELLQLKQGQMTATEYTSRVFSELVNKSRAVEECVKKAAAEKESLRPRHFANNCPEKKKYETCRVQQVGRVYTTSAVGAEGSETLIRGNYEIAGRILNALFDLGATHSFIAFEKANELGLKIVVMRLGCPQFSFRVQLREFVHDLICLPMTGLGLILGLGWLSKNHVLLDCYEKLVCFMPEDTDGPVVANSYYLNSRIIPVVCEFPEIFPNDIDEFPPEREVESAIELVPGAGSISSAPYRMSPLEMDELKDQLEDLLGKHFIRPSVSP
ncbi:uncharacterized protein [Arachis hypogaea]|uniref:uncharacterized protein n=1 Tax=Arachis hypogaea TaxID=3818 RepID=UPI000DED3729|nr:uncharacterized protein LOC112775478 [Arachis hypogaea]